MSFPRLSGSPRGLARRLDRLNRQPHRRRCRTRVRLALERLEGFEAVLRIEIDGARLRIDHHAGAADLPSHLRGEIKNEAQELPADPHRLGRFVNGETRETEDGQVLSGQLLARALRQGLDADLPRRRRGVSQDAASLNHDVSDTEVEPELILTREAVEETVEGLVVGPERRAVVTWAECPDLHRASVHGGREWVRPTRP